MALAKHYEEIAEKILTNLEGRDFEIDWRLWLQSIDQKYGGRLATAAPEYRELKPLRRAAKKPNGTPSNPHPKVVIAKMLAVLLAENERLNKDLVRTKTELGRLVKGEIIPGKIGKQSPIVRELIEQIQQLENQVRILRKK